MLKAIGKYVKRVVKEKKRTNEEQGRKMNENFFENRKLLWKEVRKYRNEKGKN